MEPEKGQVEGCTTRGIDHPLPSVLERIKRNRTGKT